MTCRPRLDPARPIVLGGISLYGRAYRERGSVVLSFLRPRALAASVMLAGVALAGPSDAQVTKAYTYDEQGQLTSVTTNDDVILRYGYDQSGNRTDLFVTTYLNESFAGNTYRLYDVALGRAPTDGELGSWVTYFESGGSLDYAAAIFLGDAGVQARWGGANTSNATFVANMYVFAFHRVAAPSEIDVWSAALQNATTTRPAMLAFFSEHAAHRSFTDSSLTSTLTVTTTDVNSRAAQVYRLYPHLGPCALARGNPCLAEISQSRRVAADVRCGISLRRHGGRTVWR